MRKIDRDYTAMGHIVSDNDAEHIPNVPFIRASRLVALELAIGDGLLWYVSQLLIIAECITARIAIGDELRIYVQQLLLFAECIAAQIAISDEFL